MSKQRHEGYLLIDNRNGPGVSAEFIQSTGKEAPATVEGAVYESATITCVHCNTIVILNPQRTRPRGHCQKCDAYICDNPICHKECRPFNALLDTVEQRAFKDLANQNQGMFTLTHKEP